MTRPRAYLAGPMVFLRDNIAEGERLKAVCDAWGVEGVFPMDTPLDLPNGFESVTDAAVRRAVTARAIAAACERGIRECDAVLACMEPFRGPGMDGGSAFEMGYARAMGKPVLGYARPGPTLFDKVCAMESMQPVVEEDGRFFASDGYEIENFGMIDNLMMTMGADAILPSFEAAVMFLATRLGVVPRQESHPAP